MKKIFLMVMLIGAASTMIISQASANLLFVDNFDASSLDTSKWPTVETSVNGAYPIGTVTQTNGEMKVKIEGGGPGGSVFARSQTFLSGAGWSEIAFSGTWRLNGYTSESRIAIYNASNNRYFGVGYASWDHNLYFYNYLGQRIGNYALTNPYPNDSMFEIVFTPTGWEYYHNDQLLKSFSSTDLSGTNSFYVKAGGGDYWYRSNAYETAYYDDFQVNDDLSPIPEPATMSLIGLGLAGLLRLRRKNRV